MNDDLLTEKEVVDYISNLMEKTDVKYNEMMIEKLAKLVLLLKKWNSSLNLTSLKTVKDFVVLHVIDSAVISPLLDKNWKNIADVGTGAGFPGLVLAVLNPDINFTLIDSVSKKLSFVRNAKISLKLDNVNIINDRCEHLKPEKKFDCIVSRAFAPLSKIIEWCSHLLEDNGSFLCMKGNVEDKELKDVGNRAFVNDIIDLKVPSLEANRKAIFIKVNRN